MSCEGCKNGVVPAFDKVIAICEQLHMETTSTLKEIRESYQARFGPDDSLHGRTTAAQLDILCQQLGISCCRAVSFHSWCPCSTWYRCMMPRMCHRLEVK